MERKYNEPEINALRQGGAQRLYIGNLPEGEHTLSVFFHGNKGKEQQTTDAKNFLFRKTKNRKTIELHLTGLTGKSDVVVKEWD